MKICDRLIAVGSVICYNVSADNLSTFRTGGKIDTLVYPMSSDALTKASEILADTPYIMLGNGSNTLISDNGVDNIILSPKRLRGHEVLSDGIYVEAGLTNTETVKLARDNGYKGIEFLSGIPGTMGGAIYMNAGAFGSTISEYIEYVDIAKNGTIEHISGQNIDFGYRHSGIDGIIVGAKLRLSHGNPILISSTIKKYLSTRRKCQPNEPSLGSVFKRVDDISAGYYIEKAGLSGYRIGGAEVSMRHANFIVNTGNALSSDFIALAELCETEVMAKFGIKLEREVRYIGRGFEEI